MQMQVINFANPISPAQRSWVQEGGNFLLVATSPFCPLPTPPTRDTRLFEILDFRTNSGVPVFRPRRVHFEACNDYTFRKYSFNWIVLSKLHSCTPAPPLPSIEREISPRRIGGGPILRSLKCNLEERKKEEIRFYLLSEWIVITSMGLGSLNWKRAAKNHD